MRPLVEVGQVYASTNKEAVRQGWNQRRAVLEVTTKRRYRGYRADPPHEDVPVAVLTCDGNGGRMTSKVALAADGSLPRHELVSEPDPRIKQMAEVFRGITEREPYGGMYDHHASTFDLADAAYKALLWPRTQDGKQNPRIEVTLHQDALAAIAQRLLELASVVEQNAMAATFMLGGHELLPAEREALGTQDGVPVGPNAVEDDGVSPRWDEPDL